MAAHLLSTEADVGTCVDALIDEAHVALQEFVWFKRVLPVHSWIGDATGTVVVAEHVGRRSPVPARGLFPPRHA